MDEQEHEYLTFLLGDGEFGVDILCVQEIMVLAPTTKMPGLPDYVRGVINLRGTIVPVVDLRIRFGMDEREYDATTVVIVLRIKSESKISVLGIVVDAVSEVYKLTAGQLKEAPDFGNAIDNCFIDALGVVDEKLVILLNTEQLLNVNQLYKISASVEPEKSKSPVNSDADLA